MTVQCFLIYENLCVGFFFYHLFNEALSTLIHLWNTKHAFFLCGLHTFPTLTEMMAQGPLLPHPPSPPPPPTTLLLITVLISLNSQ